MYHHDYHEILVKWQISVIFRKYDILCHYKRWNTVKMAQNVRNKARDGPTALSRAFSGSLLIVLAGPNSRSASDRVLVIPKLLKKHRF